MIVAMALMVALCATTVLAAPPDDSAAGDTAPAKIAVATEYQWHRDAANDPFARFAK